MTEQKREPKAGEWWWVNHANEVQVGYVRRAKWMLCGMTGLADATPIAPVISRELARELVEALDKLARLGNGQHYGNSDGNCIAQAALAKADQAGLDVQS